MFIEPPASVSVIPTSGVSGAAEPAALASCEVHFTILQESNRRGIEPRAIRLRSLPAIRAAFLHALVAQGAWQSPACSRRASAGQSALLLAVRQVARLRSPQKRRSAVDSGPDRGAILFARQRWILWAALATDPAWPRPIVRFPCSSALPAALLLLIFAALFFADNNNNIPYQSRLPTFL